MARASFQRRVPALLALIVPTLAGVAYLAAFGAPMSYVAINAGALLPGLAWIAFGRAPSTKTGNRIVMAVLLALFFAPLVTGPETVGVARWLPVGPFVLHSGALAFPALAVLAARQREDAALVLSLAVLAALFQPDAALGFAIVFAAAGLHDRTKDWSAGLVAIVGFLAAIAMALRGELPAQPFVERVLVDTAIAAPLVALGLFAALGIGFWHMLARVPLEPHSRFALAGSLFGFSLMAILSNYPSVLIGYGAAPILGYALALGLVPSAPQQEPA